MFRCLTFLSVFSVLAVVPSARATDPFLKPHDVVALVGGEDMVAASEYGYLELLLQRALPDYQLKVRSLAWEGDTVFEQPRDLNYPTLEQQLDEIGATVVVMQFGQMESLAGTSKLPEFIKAYEKLIERVSVGGKRRIMLVGPSGIADKAKAADAVQYDRALGTLPGRKVYLGSRMPERVDPRREGLHLSASGESLLASYIAVEMVTQYIAHSSTPDPKTGRPYPNVEVRTPKLAGLPRQGEACPDNDDETLRQLIVAKNRLWFHYTRPQNWAFLAGDRTEQPSSRDHKDPSKRWFPEEMKEWLPLIEAKEKEIWALAAKAAKP